MPIAEVQRTTALDLFLGTQAVVGQERARKQLAVLLDRQVGVRAGLYPRSSGAIVAGWTGTGKTYLTRMMCGLTGLPFAEVNATQYTESGYAGEDLSQMFLPLLEAAARQYDGQRALPPSSPPPTTRAKSKPTTDRPSVLKRPAPQLAQIIEIASTGVILLDEFDKWLQRVNHVTGRIDTAIQAELLKMVEGSEVYISDDEDEIGVPFDTSRVLILCAGAFVGLAKQVATRLHLPSDGWEKNPTLWEQVEPEDFIRFGLIPELAGRLSTHVFLRPLTPQQLGEIMALPGGVVDEYRQRFERYGVRWAVDDAALHHLAGKALDRDIGARGVEHVMWQTFGEALFQAAASDSGGAVRYAVNEHRARVEA